MKLDQAEAIMRISELSFLHEPHMIRFADFFEHAIEWVLKNPPGSCCIDVRASPSFDSSLDASFFTLDGGGSAAIARRPLKKFYFLEKTFAGKQIAFNHAALGGWCGNNRFSFDWVSRKPGSANDAFPVPLDSAIDFSAFRLKLVNRFFVSEEKA